MKLLTFATLAAATAACAIVSTRRVEPPQARYTADDLSALECMAELQFLYGFRRFPEPKKLAADAVAAAWPPNGGATSIGHATGFVSRPYTEAEKAVAVSQQVRTWIASGLFPADL